jgi:hypothetical protein
MLASRAQGGPSKRNAKAPWLIKHRWSAPDSGGGRRIAACSWGASLSGRASIVSSRRRSKDEAGAGHRLDHRADGLAVDPFDPARESSQRLTIWWRDELVEVFSLVGEQTDVELASTQIQSSVQHVGRASSVLVFRDTSSVSPTGALLHGSPKREREEASHLSTASSCSDRSHHLGEPVHWRAVATPHLRACTDRTACPSDVMFLRTPDRLGRPPLSGGSNGRLRIPVVNPP